MVCQPNKFILNHLAHLRVLVDQFPLVFVYMVAPAKRVLHWQRQVGGHRKFRDEPVPVDGMDGTVSGKEVKRAHIEMGIPKLTLKDQSERRDIRRVVHGYSILEVLQATSVQYSARIDKMHPAQRSARYKWLILW